MSNQFNTTVIYLIGNPGAGKYTISQELSKEGYIVCDNQLINNPIFELLGYDGTSKIPKIGWDAIGHIRKAVFDFLSKEHDHNYVLTNCLYETKGDRECYTQVLEMVEQRQSTFIPVKLTLSLEQNTERITNPLRRNRLKSIDPNDLSLTKNLIKIDHPNLLTLDVTDLSPVQVRQRILDHISKRVGR